MEQRQQLEILKLIQNIVDAWAIGYICGQAARVAASGAHTEDKARSCAETLVGVYRRHRRE